jgi:hypothetical protein
VRCGRRREATNLRSSAASECLQRSVARKRGCAMPRCARHPMGSSGAVKTPCVGADAHGETGPMRMRAAAHVDLRVWGRLCRTWRAGQTTGATALSRLTSTQAPSGERALTDVGNSPMPVPHASALSPRRRHAAAGHSPQPRAPCPPRPHHHRCQRSANVLPLLTRRWGKRLGGPDA